MTVMPCLLGDLGDVEGESHLMKIRVIIKSESLQTSLVIPGSLTLTPSGPVVSHFFSIMLS